MKNSPLITDDEKQTIRAARKVMEKLVKRYTRLREKGGYATCEREEPHYKMFKELVKLKVDVDIDNNGSDETVQLSLNSGLYGYSTEEF